MSQRSLGEANLSPTADERVHVLLGLVQGIGSGESVPAIQARIGAAMRSLIAIDRLAILLRDADDCFHAQYSDGLSDEYLKALQDAIDAGIGLQSLQPVRTLSVHDVLTGAEFWPLQDAAQVEGFRSVLVCPAYVGVEIVAYLHMYTDDSREFSSTDIDIGET